MTVRRRGCVERMRLLRGDRPPVGRRTWHGIPHAPDIVLIYESGTVGARPDVLPLSIGDGELADTATAIVRCPRSSRTGFRAGA